MLRLVIKILSRTIAVVDVIAVLILVCMRVDVVISSQVREGRRTRTE